MQSAIVLSEVYTFCLNGVSQELPGDWHFAQLDGLRSFLVGEAAKGVWQPVEGLPL